MKKKFIIYSDLSKKQLEHLKDFYIQKKVDDMSHTELKQFALEIITHQINDTIGKEEEMEAWKEMSLFFGDKFEIIIQEIQKKFAHHDNQQDMNEDTRERRLELLEKNNSNNEKEDMWDD